MENLTHRWTGADLSTTRCGYQRPVPDHSFAVSEEAQAQRVRDRSVTPSCATCAELLAVDAQRFHAAEAEFLNEMGPFLH